MVNNKITLKEVLEKLSENQKKSKSGLQLVKHFSNGVKVGR